MPARLPTPRIWGALATTPQKLKFSSFGLGQGHWGGGRARAPSPHLHQHVHRVQLSGSHEVPRLSCSLASPKHSHTPPVFPRKGGVRVYRDRSKRSWGRGSLSPLRPAFYFMPPYLNAKCRHSRDKAESSMGCPVVTRPHIRSSSS